jgi:Domain of unknown function (DUF4288)
MWFAVNLLYESVHEPPASQNLWEERIIIVQADSDESALHQGESLAKAEEHDYVSAQGNHVRWIFRGVERVFPIDAEQLSHGTEVFARFLKTSEVQSILEKFPDESERVSKSKSA